MASLNTLRTKFGVVLSIVIGLALLAFVLSLKTEMGFSGNDPKVGVIDGNKIKYSEYITEYEQVKQQSGASDGDAQQADQLADATWQAMVSRYVLEPGFEKMGITVGEAERMGIITGEHYSMILYNAFSDPRTGLYRVSSVTDFLTQAETNVQAQQAWSILNKQMLMERKVNKYLALLKGGVYVNSLEVAEGVKAANNMYSGKWAGIKYASVPDSLFEVSSSEIRSYYNSYKNKFKQRPSRTISYVVFDVAATDDDMLALEQTVTAVGAEFAASTDLKSFVRGNRNGQISDRYVSAAQLAEDEVAALMAGNQYGPVLKNNTWTMARVMDAVVAPDTLGIRHIVLPYSEERLADSLLMVLRGGADFAEMARNYSVYDATAANGGDVGVMPFSSFTGEFVAPLANAQQGDIVKVASGDAIQLMQVYRAGKPTKHVQIASVTYPVDASEATRGTIHNSAGTFSVNAKGSVANFNEAAADAVVTPRVATIAQGERQLNGLEDSREIVRWAYGAEKDDVSEIFTIGGDYVIAIVTGIDDKKYTSLKNASEQIKTELLRDKKYDYIVKDLKGISFDEMAQSFGSNLSQGDFSDLNYQGFYIQGLGVEPRLVGAIASATQTGVASAPVKGTLGVYVFEVANIATEEKQTPDGEKVRAQSVVESMMEQRSLQALQQMADMEDLRGQYL